MSKNVLVVGMPRSGTSMTTAIFARRGYFVANDPETELRAGDEFNSEGYFESSDLIEANVRILGRAGFAHHNTWKFDPIPEDQADSISKLDYSQEDADFVEQFRSNSPWVWKDPRLCYTLGYWWQYLGRTDTVVLLVHRSSRDIHRSFQRIGWRDASKEDCDDVDSRTTAHIAAAKRAIEHYEIPFCEYQYEDYKSNPRDVLRKINDLAGLDISIEDLGFRSEFDHSSGRGAFERTLESIAQKCPKPIIRFSKRVVPRALLGLLFPSRFS